MNHPDVDLVSAVALDEPVPDQVRDHVAACPLCRAEVEALRETRDVLREPSPALVAPPAALRASVLAAAFSDGSGSRAGGSGSVPAVQDVRREATDADAPAPVRSLADAPRRRRFGVAWIAGAAAAGVAIGALGVSVLDRAQSPAQPAVTAQVKLDTLDTGQAIGTADLSERGGVADLTVRTRPIASDGGYIEVWLINRDLKRMVSIGVLEPGSTDQTFTVPAALVAQGYVIVDVSREPFDEDARHSGQSLMRGTLPV